MGIVTLSRWGNSSAIRIPAQVMKKLDLQEGTELEVMITAENHILLRPVHQEQETNAELKEHLSKLLSQIKPDSPRHDEIDVGIEGDELI